MIRRALSWLWDHLEESACALLLLVMALIAFVNVVIRYLTNYSFAFTEEVEVGALVYLTLFGGAAAFRRGLHLGLQFVYERLPRPARQVVSVLSLALVFFVFGTLTYYGIFQIRDEMDLETLSEALEVPQWIYTLAVPLGSVLVMVRAVERTVELWGREKGPSKAKETR
ncbi:TRAP-type C4-dicarboxylate transport system, small permease component [Desulfacinum hydrothermale DSM 13146]|uniref:TRAP-type C4-dicarboxylate transport system, small permease component n=1 Tax=Desulfacinum hydrothermale DSM 13146 TaxID=1121390 RepID=A0A1W1X0I2_9BACT|nr:TRAP transporter small permease [Desulfacinum hydrothermale]SMC17353.1 TRAP-type C4-dicarboxylate transport system, small permease component [Desulfacinum hydrothermale DSM 13146]